MDIGEIDPYLPEEGDEVKSLVKGSTEEQGRVLQLDEEDNALVRFPDNSEAIYQIDFLCKVANKEDFAWAGLLFFFCHFET